jgi:superfamily II DNA or RNA helicase
MYIIYLASSPVFKALFMGKLGCTTEPYGRMCTYLTGCPPGLTPSHDIEYDVMWETTATTSEELMDMEDEVHNKFLPFRMMRSKPGDSEWFNFRDRANYDAVAEFMNSRPWVKRQVPLSEIAPPASTSQYLRKQYKRNLHFARDYAKRIAILEDLQQPVIDAITAFVTNDLKSGTVIAPCGSGKTIMTSKGIKGIQRVIICCPSQHIQMQWYTTLVALNIFNACDILFIGGSGTTEDTTIRDFMRGETYCMLSTYMSSHLLVNNITTDVNMLVSDEAHHMAGIVANEDKGEGRTRRLMMKAAELGVKRLSLTYTPRFIRDNGGIEAKYLSMDDDAIFGPTIAELKIRDLIKKGVLPDYRLWMLRDEGRKGTGVIGKAEMLLEAWKATEVYRGEERFILHHLVVFAATTQEARDLERFLASRTMDTVVVRVEEGEVLKTPIERFTAASRAILVNCRVLNEGVDIPIANSVAIMYPKHSRGEITQMILRAGRWYEGKPIFHVLIPTLGDEDLSGFEEVLSSLASCDEQLRDEVCSKYGQAKPKSSDGNSADTEYNDQSPECIMIEEYEANTEAIRNCFSNVRKNLFPSKESRRIQELCVAHGVRTSVNYALMRLGMPELPEDPRFKGMSWYDYLHPLAETRMTIHEFVKGVLEPMNLRVGHMYDDWHSKQSEDAQAKLPTIQNIDDGYFGKEDTSFDAIYSRFIRKAGRR